MATQRQIKANRENAQHSTGPRTVEGKRRTARNAVTHGLVSKNPLIPGEDPAEYNELLLGFHDTFRPSSPCEHTLVRQMVDAEWRLRRVSRLETALVCSAFEDRRRLVDDYDEPDRDADTDYVLGKLMQNCTEEFIQFGRYESRLRRAFTQALKQLIELRELATRERALAFEEHRCKLVG